jgi:F-type H+-transporting ATPase subunit b
LERDKIVAAAKEMAAKIEQEADNKAAGVVAKARTELREEASRLAVELAEDMLKKQVSADDQKRLVEEYMQKMGELH